MSHYNHSFSRDSPRKMQVSSIIVCVVVMAAVVWAAPDADTYSTKYDNIDVDKLLKNERVVTQYVNCMLDKGPCTAEGRVFRQRLPEALSTSCAKCTDAQKNIIRKTSAHIITKRPADWELIRQKYDPKSLHKTSFERFLKGTN